MIKKKRGIIINIASTPGILGKANNAVYCASKFGVIGFSESVAEEVRRFGIKVQVLLPNGVKSQNDSFHSEQALDAGDVADFIIHLLTLPADTILNKPIIGPFYT